MPDPIIAMPARGTVDRKLSERVDEVIWEQMRELMASDVNLKGHHLFPDTFDLRMVEIVRNQRAMLEVLAKEAEKPWNEKLAGDLGRKTGRFLESLSWFLTPARVKESILSQEGK